MIISRQKRSVVAARVALGFVVAGTLVGAAPSYAAPADPCPKHFPMSNYHCTHQAYPNPEYPNHKPLRGNYPGSYTSSQSTPVQQTSSRFDWLAAGVGAAGMLGLVLLLTAIKTRMRMARNRGHDVPLVVQIDDHPGELAALEDRHGGPPSRKVHLRRRGRSMMPTETGRHGIRKAPGR